MPPGSILGTAKLKDVKFSDFSSLKQEQIDSLERCLTGEIPKLMEGLPSEKDPPETLRRKMGGLNVTNANLSNVPVPLRSDKFGKNSDDNAAYPSGFGTDNEDQYW